MPTAFDDADFLRCELTNAKGTIICTMRNESGRYQPDLIRQNSSGDITGRMIDPPKRPDWLIPGTILYGIVQGYKLSLTLEPIIPSRIAGLTDELGEKLRFSYVVVAEFKDA